jgi:hypothetical protein
MGGGLVLSSRPGEGSTFSVSLPLLKAAPEVGDLGVRSLRDTGTDQHGPDAGEQIGQALTEAGSQVLVQRSG